MNIQFESKVEPVLISAIKVGDLFTDLKDGSIYIKTNKFDQTYKTVTAVRLCDGFVDLFDVDKKVVPTHNKLTVWY